MLGVPPTISWDFCSMNVNAFFGDDEYVSYVDFFPHLLQNLKVLLYNGQDDIIVNVAG